MFIIDFVCHSVLPAVAAVVAVVFAASSDIVAILSAHVKRQTTTFCLHWRVGVGGSRWVGDGGVVSLRLSYGGVLGGMAPSRLPRRLDDETWHSNTTFLLFHFPYMLLLFCFLPATFIVCGCAYYIWAFMFYLYHFDFIDFRFCLLRLPFFG